MKYTHNTFFQYSIEVRRHQSWMQEKAFLGELTLKPAEVLCFCTGLTKSHFSRLVKEANEKYSLETLMVETRAGYHCTGCREDLKNFWEEELARSGLRSPKVIMERSRIGKNGERTTYLGKFPNYWVVKLVELQEEWRTREDFVESFVFEIIDAPVPFVDFVLVGDCEAKKADIYFTHFTQFVEEKTKAKWNFSLISP